MHNHKVRITIEITVNRKNSPPCVLPIAIESGNTEDMVIARQVIAMVSTLWHTKKSLLNNKSAIYQKGNNTTYIAKPLIVSCESVSSLIIDIENYL